MKIHIFDLHCDTVSECLDQAKSLWQNDLQLDISRGLRFECWVQTFAFFIHDTYRGQSAYERFLTQYAFFEQHADRLGDRLNRCAQSKTIMPGVCNAILSIEGGSVIGDDLTRIAQFKQKGISFLTLCWNGENAIAGGAHSDKHLTVFGKAVVHELERQGIVIDVSHLNRQSFWDVCDWATKPIVATHSNADAICAHARNLEDTQIREIAQRGGLIGLNLYPVFVNGKTDCSCDEILRHVERVFQFGNEQVLAIGTDFDGAAMPSAINRVEKLEILYTSMVQFYGQALTDQVFYQNAHAFAHKHLF